MEVLGTMEDSTCFFGKYAVESEIFQCEINLFRSSFNFQNMTFNTCWFQPSSLVFAQLDG